MKKIILALVISASFTNLMAVDSFELTPKNCSSLLSQAQFNATNMFKTKDSSNISIPSRSTLYDAI